MEEETTEHLFFNCTYAKAVWRGSGISNRLLYDPRTPWEEKLREILKCNTGTRTPHLKHLPLWILWRLWISRNNLTFQQRNFSWRKVIRQARSDAKEWHDQDERSLGMTNPPQFQNVGFQGEYHWMKPNTNWIKCNYDGSFINGQPASAG
ncbi:hypothetical protein AtEden1_Chr4g0289971 [Arabidopsis thaliana]|uniref:Reverse transcriptase zinc-binding domain-containing protein n=2 Tax=Arabidopsis thaliana TaxID=3702 RepID=Q1G384_ARATH|nr:unknown protein [Arabidopsis thaliana]